jgi:hypothetical protein
MYYCERGSFLLKVTLLVSGNDALVFARLPELPEAGLDELIVALAPISEPTEGEQQAMHLICHL